MTTILSHFRLLSNTKIVCVATTVTLHTQQDIMLVMISYFVSYGRSKRNAVTNIIKTIYNIDHVRSSRSHRRKHPGVAYTAGAGVEYPDLVGAMEVLGAHQRATSSSLYRATT